jgi:hypothetical protein
MTSWTGGCQCGAVRFRVEGELGRATICHCRMCQKATGGFFGPYVSVAARQVTWTRGRPKPFRSSNKVIRGFCADCGTPLTFEYSDQAFDISIGAFDRAADIAPKAQLSADTALPYVAGLADLPRRDPEVSPGLAAHLAGIVSYQHPDHDTEAWPPPR